jgi:bacteriocin-like protein
MGRQANAKRSSRRRRFSELEEEELALVIGGAVFDGLGCFDQLTRYFRSQGLI